MRPCRPIRPAPGPAAALAAGLVMGLTFPGPVGAREGERCEREPTNMVIEFGDVVRCEIDPDDDRDSFRFVGGSGQTIRVQLTDRTGGAARPCFRLRDPDNESLGRTACGDLGQDFTLERTGSHRIVVTGDADEDDGRIRYTLALDRIDPTSPAAVPIDYGQQFREEIDRAGDLDAYFFVAEENDRVAIKLSDRTSGSASPCFRLYDPSGEALTGQRCGSRTERFRLETAGRHSILVTERSKGGQDEVEYRLRLTCISGRCPPAGIREILGCLTVRGGPLRNGRVQFNQPDEERQTDGTDVRGCARFRPADGKPFEFRVRGPAVPN